MKTLKYKASFLIIAFLFLNGCNAVKVSKAGSLPALPPTQTIVQKKSLNEINLSEIKHIAAKGRAQDESLEGENFAELSIADDLLAHGKDSIPFLIGKLGDETEMKRGTVDFWYNVYVGDVALIILNDFFTKKDGSSSTIPGFSWDEFLERGNDKGSTGEEILRRYIKKHGRKGIQDRWQKMWDENKDKIYWNETERCFDLRK